MNDLFPHLIAAPLALTDKQVRQTLALLDDGATTRPLPCWTTGPPSPSSAATARRPPADWTRCR